MAKLGKYWIIKEMRTDNFLGLIEGTRSGKGFTHVEPSDIGPPRLFTSQRAASCALGWWLKGPFEIRDLESGYIEPVMDKPYRDPNKYYLSEVCIMSVVGLQILAQDANLLSAKIYPNNVDNKGD